MEEADVAHVQRSLENILEFLVSALKQTSRDGVAFLSCFKNRASWPVVVGKDSLANRPALTLDD